jgi:hypothetical protein
MDHRLRDRDADRLLRAATSGPHRPGSFSQNERWAVPPAYRRVLLLPVARYFRASTARRSWSLFILDLPSTPSFRASS